MLGSIGYALGDMVNIAQMTADQKHERWFSKVSSERKSGTVLLSWWIGGVANAFRLLGCLVGSSACVCYLWRQSVLFMLSLLYLP